MQGIEGKVVAITGASTGIGEATAELLAAQGARLVLGARGAERLQAVAERIGGDVAWLPVDVAKAEDVAALVALAQERFGRLDVLVANAGIMPVSPFDALRLEDWTAMVDVNLKGVLHGIAAALPVFRAQGGGHFVHVASTAAHRIVPAQGVYAATKTAVRVLSEALRQEAGPDLRVTVVSPGFTATRFADGITDPAMRAQLEERGTDIAMGPDAVARAIAYAIGQPADVEVGEVIVRPTAQA